MARETKAVKDIAAKLNELQGVRVYETINVDKWDTLQFDYIGILHSEDTRELEPLEDNSAMVNRGSIELYLLLGASVKKSTTNKGLLREALADLCERVENKLHNQEIETYISDYETTFFAPIHFVGSQVIQYNDDQTKGMALMTFRTKYIRSN